MVGGIDHGQQADKKLFDEAALVLNMILKEMSLAFPNLHAVSTATFNCVTGQASYTQTDGIPTDIQDIQTATYIDSPTNDIELYLMEAVEWESFRDKTSTGVPQKLFLTKEIEEESRTIYVYPVPQDDSPIRLRYWRRIFDVDLGADNLDVPPEAYSYLVHKLAAELAEEFPSASETKAQRLFDKQRILGQDLKAKLAPKTTNFPVKERKFY
jgi:hypothetical protein